MSLKRKKTFKFHEIKKKKKELKSSMCERMQLKNIILFL